jgi:hypothetical protein
VGRKILSKRRATIEAITGKGDEVVMESQIVVDYTEVDENGRGDAVRPDPRCS